MNLIEKRNWFFALSLIIIIPGVLAFFVWGLKFGIDFTGGTLWEIKFVEKQQVEPQDVKKVFEDSLAQVNTIATTSENSVLVRTKITEEQKIEEVKVKLKETFGKTEDVRLDTVGPVVSKELTKKAVLAVAIAIFAILAYITWSFRKVPKPASSLAFGVATVIALVHDVIVVVGIFAILGHFLNIEIDSLFITALLTVLGFSVHDTIVVFDRVRENLIKEGGEYFDEVVNKSLLQTLGRSLATSLTVVFVLFALFLFGGVSTKNFILALLIGIVSGTHSSIFNAAPLLVVWNNLSKKLRRKS